MANDDLRICGNHKYWMCVRVTLFIQFSRSQREHGTPHTCITIFIFTYMRNILHTSFPFWHLQIHKKQIYYENIKIPFYYRLNIAYVKAYKTRLPFHIEPHTISLLYVVKTKSKNKAKKNDDELLRRKHLVWFVREETDLVFNQLYFPWQSHANRIKPQSHQNATFVLLLLHQQSLSSLIARAYYFPQWFSSSAFCSAYFPFVNES